MIKKLIDLAEKGIMPDFLIRSGIRRMQKEKFAELGYEYNPSFTGYNSSNMDLDNWS